MSFAKENETFTIQITVVMCHVTFLLLLENNWHQCNLMQYRFVQNQFKRMTGTIATLTDQLHEQRQVNAEQQLKSAQVIGATIELLHYEQWQ